jgi:hypothetical protein
MKTRRRRGTVYAEADEREHLGGGFSQRRDAVRRSQPNPWHHGADILGKNGSPILSEQNLELSVVIFVLI